MDQKRLRRARRRGSFGTGALRGLCDVNSMALMFSCLSIWYGMICGDAVCCYVVEMKIRYAIDRVEIR
jgi:hypothetical protein